jgi:glycosyltransferase involved in cell wall biosynthesis
MTPSAAPVCIGLTPQLSGVGGPSSFNQKLIVGLAARGIQVTSDLNDPRLAVVLVNGGTRRLDRLWRLRRRGVRLVQRLDGMNWIHRKRFTGLRHFLRSEQNNWVLAYIRSHLAQHVVYQSEFSRAWWERVYTPLHGLSTSVVLNGVDLQSYTPQGPGQLPQDRIRLLTVEGHLRGGNEVGLENAFRIAENLSVLLSGRGDLPLELQVVADVPEIVRRDLSRHYPGVRVAWSGVVPRERIPEIDRSAHLFFSSELNAPCPNAVIEALACGLPVIGFSTGSLPELIRDGAGRLVPYGPDPFSLAPPDVAGLAQAAADLLRDVQSARVQARARAETAFGLDAMLDGYLKALRVDY